MVEEVKRSKVLIYSIGICCLIANSIVLYITFLSAYFSDGQAITITVNNFSESYIEFILIPLSLIIGMYTLFSLFRNVLIKSGRVTTR
jgi:hypothetical protein